LKSKNFIEEGSFGRSYCDT